MSSDTEHTVVIPGPLKCRAPKATLSVSQRSLISVSEHAFIPISEAAFIPVSEAAFTQASETAVSILQGPGIPPGSRLFVFFLVLLLGEIDTAGSYHICIRIRGCIDQHRVLRNRPSHRSSHLGCAVHGTVLNKSVSGNGPSHIQAVLRMCRRSVPLRISILIQAHLLQVIIHHADIGGDLIDLSLTHASKGNIVKPQIPKCVDQKTGYRTAKSGIGVVISLIICCKILKRLRRALHFLRILQHLLPPLKEVLGGDPLSHNIVDHGHLIYGIRTFRIVKIAHESDIVLI